MQFKRDIQNEESFIDGLPIGKVGIKEVYRKIDILKDKIRLSINAKISAFISLPGTQRGIHMSRTAESIEHVINSATYNPARTVEEFCLRITDLLFNEHDYTKHTEVEMAGTVFVTSKATERDQTQKAHEIYAKVIAEKQEDGEISREVYVGISAQGITACPCAQEMSREYAKEIIKSRDIEVQGCNIDDLINLIPIASHNQRAKGKIIIGNGDGNKELVDVLKLIDVIEGSMSGRIRSILKRPDESELVRIAHLNPRFVEDVARNIIVQLADEEFSNIPDDCTIQVTVESLESIHYHNAYAEINTDFNTIRKNFGN